MPVAARDAFALRTFRTSRPSRLLALGAGLTVGALALAGCTSSEEAPEPLTIDVVNGTFPDAREAGILEILGEDLDTGYSTTMLDDGSILVSGSSDGEVDDSVGVLDPSTGEVDWLVTADIAEGSYVVPGDVTEKWVTWSVETEEGVTPEDAIPYVFALNRETQETHVLADGRGEGGFAPGTSGGRVFIAGDLAVWEGSVPVEDTVGGTGGNTGADDDASGDEVADDEIVVDDEAADDEVVIDDELPAASSTVFARSLDATAGVLTVASEAGSLSRDACLEGLPVTVQVAAEEGIETRTVTTEGALGAVLAPVAAGEGEDVWLRCGAGGVVETLSEDGAVLTKAVLRGEGRDIILAGDGVADLQVVGLAKDWAAVWVGDLDTSLGAQLIVHRPTGKVFSLGDSEPALLVLRPGYVAFGGSVEEILFDDEAEGEDGSEIEGDDGTIVIEEDGTGGNDGGTEADGEVIDGDVEFLDEDDADVEFLDEDEIDASEDDYVEEDFAGGALTTIARLVAPPA